VKAPIIQTDEVLAKLKSKKRWLRFEDDMFHPEVELNPGEDRKLRIASFYRKYGWKMVVEVINLDGERIAFNDLEIPDAQKLTFRLSADDMQAQEWEICFGKNGNELWAKGTKVYPISNGPPYTDKITLEGS
jgi:hypothetical protein